MFYYLTKIMAKETTGLEFRLKIEMKEELSFSRIKTL